MKPYRNMSKEEIKAYMEYRSKNKHKLTPEDHAEYRQMLAWIEEDEGCDYSVVPMEILHQGPEATNSYYEKILEKRAKKRELTPSSE